jgi:hypothetical protein
MDGKKWLDDTKAAEISALLTLLKQSREGIEKTRNVYSSDESKSDM